MKKVGTVLLLVMMIFFNVSAKSSCSYKEQTDLNSKAANVKASYEITTITKKYEDMDINSEVLKVTILNATEDLYVKVRDDYKNEEKFFHNSDSDKGVVTFIWESVDKVTNFTIEVYSSDKTNCPGEKYKTIYLTLPRYNDFYNRIICQENPDFYLCKKFVTSKQIDDVEFEKKLISYQKGLIDKDGDKTDDNNKNNGIINKVGNFVVKYKWYIIGGFILIGTSSYVIIRIKTKKQRELGL